jgi:hypothetical protein
MKGYAKVEVVRAMQARENYIKFMNNMDKVFPEYVQRYYDWKYPQLNFVDKWLRRNQTNTEFLCADSGWNGYSWPLRKVLTDKEHDDVCLYQDKHNIGKVSAAIRKLTYASSDGMITVDQDIAGFIEKWEEKS